MRLTLSIPSAALYCLAVGLGVASEPSAPTPSPDEGRLHVEAAWGQDGGRITSHANRPDGTQVLHGVQVIVGPGHRLQEYAVYNDGVLEQRTQFYPSGKTFRFQRRERNGDGYEVVYAPVAEKAAAEGKAFLQEELCSGTAKANQRWEGTFLAWEPIPNKFGIRLVVQEYRQGERIKSTPLPVEKLGLPADSTKHEGWPWTTPDWPTTANRRR